MPNSKKQVDPFTSIDLFCNMKKSQCNHLAPTLSWSKLLSKGSQLEQLALLSTEENDSSFHCLYAKTWLPMTSLFWQFDKKTQNIKR